MRVLLVRHGETEWNREDRFRGRIDVDLNDTGRAQAEACARHVAARWKPSAVYSSPLSRAIHTAEPIARLCGLTVRTLDAVADLDYGEWHGLTRAEAREGWPNAVDAWFGRPGSCQPPAGESLIALQQRAVGALRAIHDVHADETVVVVAHDIVNRAVLAGGVRRPSHGCLPDRPSEHSHQCHRRVGGRPGPDRRQRHLSSPIQRVLSRGLSDVPHRRPTPQCSGTSCCPTQRATPQVTSQATASGRSSRCPLFAAAISRLLNCLFQSPLGR